MAVQYYALNSYRDALNTVLDETFENVQGIFLDKGTSLFETLETISAEEASRPVSDTCASIAAQVNHTTYYLDLTVQFVRGPVPENVDWPGSWQVTSVTDEEWAALKNRLREAYQNLRSLVADDASWELEGALAGSLGVVAHTAYHLGEIRQALCTVKNRAA